MKSSLWTKDFILDTVINFLLYVIFYQLMLWSTKYTIVQWDASISEAGLASGIFIIGALLSRILTGHVIDTLGRKKSLLFGAIIYLGVIPLYFISGTLLSFYLVRCIHGVAYGIAATAASTIVGVIVPAQRRGEGIGYYALGNTLASAAGPFLGIVLTSTGNFSLNLYVCFALAIITLILTVILNAPEHTRSAADTAALRKISFSSFFAIQALPISIVALLCGVGYSTVLSFMGAYTESLGLAEGGSLFFFAYAITSLFSRPLTGRLLDRHGGNVVMYPTLIILALCLGTLGIASSNLFFIVGGILLGLSYSTVTSAGQALAIHGMPVNQIGLATSTFFVLIDCGVGAGPYALGSLVPVFGFSSVYLCACLIALCAIPLYYVLIGKSGVFSAKRMEEARHPEHKLGHTVAWQK
jgi:MFS family permease